MSSVSVKLYSVMSFAYLACAGVLLGVFVFVSFGKTDIILYPESHDFEATISIEAIKGADVQVSEIQRIIPVRIETVVLKGSKEMLPSGASDAENPIVGWVTLVNQLTHSQKLVEKTRLASQDGQIFRLVSTITVASKESVRVPVSVDNLAEVKGKSIEAQRLTIPGLPASVRPYMYGEFEDAFVLDPSLMKKVTRDDLVSAKQDVSQMLYQQWYDEHIKNETENIILFLGSTVRSTNASVAIGDVVSSYTYEVESESSVAYFDRSQVLEIARRLLLNRLRPNQSFLSLKEDLFMYQLRDWDKKDRVVLDVAFKGETTLADLGNVQAQNAGLARRSAADLQQYFLSFPNIKKVDVVLQPFWLKRSSLLDNRIHIKVADQ